MTERRNIPFSPPDLSETEIQEVAEAMRSGWITTGPRTKELEKQIAAFCHTDKAVCLNSATACMEMALRVLGVGEGDEVIVPAYTYTATASVVHHVGARIVMIDSQPDSVEMDYEQVAEAITERTKVIIPVDLAGIVCDYERLLNIVESKRTLFHAANSIQQAFGRIIILADAAHAFGASRKGKMAGEIADFTSFSFHAVKNFTTAEGGALTWRSREGLDNESIYKELQLLSLHGQNKDALAKTRLGAWEYDIIAPNYKCNMTDIMAAIGLEQMQRYASLLARRKTIIQAYDKAFASLPVTPLKHYTSDGHSSGHLYILRLNGKDEDYRNRLIERMAEEGIATNVHYKPLPMMTAYKALGFDIADYPNAYALYRNSITLPLHTRLSDEDVAYITDTFVRLMQE